MIDTALTLIVQGLLTELPASLITAACTALVVWAVRKRAGQQDK
ncbi:hypothetical protein [Streptomyces hydrogenans]|uniref:Uncharacterized protein n=1 Tax=Streptomyces hydrogenans TaxID=1873719 RepID=A0ABQ3PQ52_9ACTN|nr:hypothetical protein [Streptomyces hydrogenans]GHG29467.1 hypothetical protein GCM10018784_48530 [Streptomyces hydrogenans]GHI27139.1 hypothetical protein Shyd_85100 [Streptomyces hydrogenans]